MDYISVKLIHQTAVVVSIAGFAARGVASLFDAAWVRSRAARTLPHLVDTVLLVSAITLAGWLRLNPLNTPWLAAKIVALLLYIGLGMVALNPHRTKPVRVGAWLGALAIVGYIVSAALTKSAWGWLHP